MLKYLFKRLLHGLFSIIMVVVIVMILIYSLMNRQLIFASDPLYAKRLNNAKYTYRYSKWEEYGYLDYVTYADYLIDLTVKGELDEETRKSAVSFGRTADKDTDIVKEYVAEFTEYYESRGYTVERLDAVMINPKKVADGGQQQLYAYKDIPLINRLVKYFTRLITVDNVNNVKDDIEDRGLTFTLFDPLYGGKTFSPAIIGNGTTHKYLLYFDNQFPFIHQNLVTINLGTSYSVNMGVDVFKTMTSPQGSFVLSEITFPTGFTEMSADNLHTATYISGSQKRSEERRVGKECL